MGEEKPKIQVVDAYRDYTPPFPIQKIIQRLLTVIPKTDLLGLQAIYLMNASGLSKKDRRRKLKSRGRKVLQRESLGLYRPKHRRQPASIVIYVDNIIENLPGYVRWIPLIRNLAFASVLYHEIGHHLHATKHPRFKDHEDVAEAWDRYLSLRFFRRRYWYLWLITYPIRFFRPTYWRKRRKWKQAQRSGSRR